MIKEGEEVQPSQSAQPPRILTLECGWVLRCAELNYYNEELSNEFLLEFPNIWHSILVHKPPATNQELLHWGKLCSHSIELTQLIKGQ